MPPVAGAHDGREDDEDPVPAPPGKPTRPWVRVVEGLVGLAILVLIFVGVFPQFANYSEAWAAIGAMDWWWWSAIVVAAVFNLISYVWPYQAVMPGLRFGDGFTETETTAAISNTVPLGGAVALGMTYRMFGSFGFSPVAKLRRVGERDRPRPLIGPGPLWLGRPLGLRLLTRGHNRRGSRSLRRVCSRIESRNRSELVVLPLVEGAVADPDRRGTLVPGQVLAG